MHAYCSGVNIHATHWQITFDIKTEWMILETVPAEIPSSWVVTLTLTRRSCKIVSCTFWHISFEDAFTGWPERESSSIDSLPPLKLLGPKLYLLVGRWNITIYSIHLSWISFRFLPSFVRNFITEQSSKSLMFIVDPPSPPLHLPYSHFQHLRQTDLWMWLLHVKTCPYLHMQGHTWCSDVRYWGR